MLTKVQIKNFRCFRNLEVTPLRRVNLILGKNNAGKTALLEALALLLAQPNPGAKANLPNDFRAGVGSADWQEQFWSWLFHQKDGRLSIELRCSLDAGYDFGWILQRTRPTTAGGLGIQPKKGEIGGIPFFLANPQKHDVGLKAVHFSTRPSDPNQDAVDFNRVVSKRRKKDLVDLLRPIENNLDTLEALQLGRPGHQQAPLIYADVGLPEMIPVTHLGQGFCRLLDIYAEMLASEAQVLLIDEIENGLHHSVLPTIWKGLLRASKDAGLQIFATTHSREGIVAAANAAREADSYDLSLVRLDRVEGNVQATVMDVKTLDIAKEFNWELR